jgi:hypothetical protein
MREWVSANWYPSVHLGSIPCVDVESLTRRDRSDQREDALQYGMDSFCGEEDSTCACRGRVKYGRDDDWSDWHNVTGTIGCNNDVFGDPRPGYRKVCVCHGDATIYDSDGNATFGAACDDRKCSSLGDDCCAPEHMSEVATCSGGFEPVRLEQGCGGWDEGQYKCCPPSSPPDSYSPGACRFLPSNKGGMISSFADVSRVFPSGATMQETLSSPGYGVRSPWGYDIFAAITFNSIPGSGQPGAPGHWDYSIRVNATLLGDLPWRRNISLGWKQVVYSERA